MDIVLVELNEEYEPIAPRFVRVLHSLENRAKVLLVRVYSSSHPDKSLLTYSLIDDQSNRSLATTPLLNLFDVNSEEVEYSLASCACSFVFSGRVAEDCVVEAPK